MQVCNVGALRIYFAGPLFTPYERSFIDECAAALRVDGFEVFVPHEHELAAGVNLFVQGAIEDVGRVVASIEEARDVLRAWR